MEQAVLRYKLNETGEVRSYIDFLTHRSTLVESCVFAAPFIKGDPVTEKLAVWQPYSPEQLRAAVPEGTNFEHVVFHYKYCSTHEQAYVWTREILHGMDVRGTCIIVIHYSGGSFHAHVLIPPENRLGQMLSSKEGHERVCRVMLDAKPSLTAELFDEQKAGYSVGIESDDSVYGSAPLATL